MLPGGAGSGGGGSSGGYERHRLSRGPAHPYVDAVSPSAGPPLFPPYTERMQLAADTDAAAADNDGGDIGFREEDRMLLRLLYHQQQSLQVQLNTMTEWMQQVSYRIANVERVVRGARSSGTTATASPSAAPRASPAQPASRSVSAAESYVAMSSPHLASHPRPTTTTATAEQVIGVPRGQLSAPESTYGGQSQQLSSALAVSSVLEGSRACTPPSEQPRHGGGAGAGSSAVPSTTRSYESGLAAPWDPHNASQQSYGGGAVHSRTSSHTSALGRRANPLLNSTAGGRNQQQLPTAASRSTLLDSRPQQQQQQQSRLDASGLSGIGPSTSSDGAAAAPAPPRQPPVVSPPTTYADAIVPPYRRVSVETTTHARQPLSRASAAAAATRHAPPSSTLTDAAEGAHGGREGTLPPTRSEETSSLAEREDSRGAIRNTEQQQQQQQSNLVRQGGGDREKQAPSASTAVVPPAVHTDPVVNGDEHGIARTQRDVPPRRISVDDDTLSDGYGSYESRMYMKSLGLL